MYRRVSDTPNTLELCPWTEPLHGIETKWSTKVWNYLNNKMQLRAVMIFSKIILTNRGYWDSTLRLCIRSPYSDLKIFMTWRFILIQYTTNTAYQYTHMYTSNGQIISLRDTPPRNNHNHSANIPWNAQINTQYTHCLSLSRTRNMTVVLLCNIVPLQCSATSRITGIANYHVWR